MNCCITTLKHLFALGALILCCHCVAFDYTSTFFPASGTIEPGAVASWQFVNKTYFFTGSRQGWASGFLGTAPWSGGLQANGTMGASRTFEPPEFSDGSVQCTMHIEIWDLDGANNRTTLENFNVDPGELSYSCPTMYVLSPEPGTELAINTPLVVNYPFWRGTGKVTWQFSSGRAGEVWLTKGSLKNTLTTITADDFDENETLTILLTAIDSTDPNITYPCTVYISPNGVQVANGVDYTKDDPVAPFDGHVVSDPQRDFVIRDPAQPIDFYREYDSTSTSDGPFGPGWSHSYNVRLVRTGSWAYILGASAMPSVFLKDGETPLFTSQDQRALHLTMIDDTTYVLLDEQYTCHLFENGLLASITDRNGNRLSLAYAGDRLQIVSNRTACLSFSYDAVGHITSVYDNFDRATSYGYLSNMLAYAVDIVGGTTQFRYAGTFMTNYVRVDGATVTYIYGEQGEYGYGETNQCTSGSMDDDYFRTWFHYFIEGGKNKTVEFDPENLSAPTTNTFNRRGMLEKTVHPDGSSVTYTHQGTLGSSVIDENSRTTSVIYSEGQLRYLVDAKGNVTTNLYRTIPSLPDLLYNVAMPGNINTFYSYDSRTNIVRVRREGVPALEFSFSYNPDGTLAASWDAITNTWTNTYTATGWLATSTDPLGNSTHVAYNARGNATNIIGPRGNAIRMSYDAFDRPVTAISPDGATNRVFYDKAGRVAAIQDALGSVFTTKYNTVGLPVEAVDPLGNKALTTFDKRGRPTSRSIFDASDSSTHTTTNIYNNRGRLAKTVSPLGTTNEFRYDPAGNLVSNIQHQGSSIKDPASSISSSTTATTT